MRLRYIAKAEDIVNESPYVIHDALPFDKPVHEYYPSKAPLHLEIGCGKGGFLVEMARRHPEINFLGVERYESVLFRGLEKLDAMTDEERPKNILFLSRDARELPQILREDDVDCLYLNFSDPWPKARHWKRRLTAEPYLDLYEGFLKNGHSLIFKTDNQGLFEFSVEQIKEVPHWELVSVCRDLHNDFLLNKDNVMTEYERRFSALGSKINRLEAVLKK